MKGDFDWTAPATLLLLVGEEDAGDAGVGFVPIAHGTVTEMIAFHAQCSDWVRQHCRLVVPGAVQVDGCDIGDLVDRLHHAN